MARPSAADVHKIADRLTPQARGAFLRAVGDRKSDASIQAFIRALEVGDREAALAALKIARLSSGLKDVVKVLDQVFDLSGSAALVQFQMRFDLLNPKALLAAQEHAATFVVETTQETQTALRSIISRSLAEGIAPRETARLIRPIIGLTERQAQAVWNYRTELAVADEEVGRVSVLAGRYAEKLLRRRAETIARTEIIDASHTGQLAAWQEAVEAGLLDASRAMRVWIVTDDDRLCPRCLEMEGQSVPFDSPFITPEGGAIDAPTLHPNCRCTVGLET